MTAGYKVLAIVASTKRVGYVFLVGNKVADWGLSKKASQTPQAAMAKTQELIELHEPEVVVTQKLTDRSRKHGRTLEIMEAIAKVASDAPVLDVAVPHVHFYTNKYEEARALGRRFPDLSEFVPRLPKLWETEARYIPVFEALSLALAVRQSELE